MCPDNKIPQGLLMSSREEIIDAMEAFKTASLLDAENERLPKP